MLETVNSHSYAESVVELLHFHALACKHNFEIFYLLDQSKMHLQYFFLEFLMFFSSNLIIVFIKFFLLKKKCKDLIWIQIPLRIFCTRHLLEIVKTRSHNSNCTFELLNHFRNGTFSFMHQMRLNRLRYESFEIWMATNWIIFKSIFLEAFNFIDEKITPMFLRWFFFIFSVKCQR